MSNHLAPVTATLLAELQSRDSQRIWSAAWEVIRYNGGQRVIPTSVESVSMTDETRAEREEENTVLRRWNLCRVLSPEQMESEQNGISQATLRELAPFLDNIRSATENIELGGTFHSNAAVLEQALRVIQAVAAGLCHCTVYASTDFLLYDPNKEEKLGLIRIIRTTPPDWNMTYWCQCRQCGTEFEVEQGEGHTTWWQWRPVLVS